MSVGFKAVTLGGHKLILLLLPEFKKSPETPLFRTAVTKRLRAPLESQSCYIVFTPRSFPQTSLRCNPQTWLQVTISRFQNQTHHQTTKSCLRICKAVSHRLWREIQWGSPPVFQAKAAFTERNIHLLRSAHLEGDIMWANMFWFVKWQSSDSWL